jgi:hypothetical protein
MGYSVSAEAAQAGTAMANIVNKAHTPPAQRRRDLAMLNPN